MVKRKRRKLCPLCKRNDGTDESPMSGRLLCYACFRVRYVF